MPWAVVYARLLPLLAWDLASGVALLVALIAPVLVSIKVPISNPMICLLVNILKEEKI